jgi:hypothetical protein
MRKFFSLLSISIVLLIGVSQAQEKTGFMFDNLYVGPTIGYTLIFDGSLGIGGRAEYGLMDNVDIGSFSGSIGVGAELGYSSYTSSAVFNDWKWSYTLIDFLVYGSYHFKPHNEFDPYVRVGLGYNHISASWSGPSEINQYSSGWGSGIGFNGSIGFNYHFSNSMLFRADLGYPFLIAVGLDFNLGNMGWQQPKK